MGLGKVVYSTDKNLKNVLLCQKNYAPEIGSVFTSQLCERKNGGGDYTVFKFRNYTGYVKKGGHVKEEELVEGRFYRFIIVAVHSRNFHNYFYAVPFRELSEGESYKRNVLNPEGFVKLKDLADRLLGINNGKRRRNNRKVRQGKGYKVTLSNL